MAVIPTQRRWWLIPAAAGILAIALASAVRLHHRPPPGLPAPAPANPRLPLVLRAQRDDPAVRLTWDRDSRTIRNATHATVYINDGNHHSRLELNSAELASGRMSYWPETGDITFRLEVLSAAGTVAETIRVEGVVVPSPLAVTSAAANSSAPALRDTPRQVLPHAARTKRPARESAGEVDEIAYVRPSPFASPKAERTAPPVAPALHPSEAVPELPPAVAAQRRVPPLPDDPAPAAPGGGSRWGRLIGRIPLLRHWKKQPQPQAITAVSGR